MFTFFVKINLTAGEMSQWLREVTTPTEDLGSFSSQHLHGCSEPSVTPVSEDAAPSSGFHWLLYIHVVDTNPSKHTHTYRNSLKFTKKNFSIYVFV